MVGRILRLALIAAIVAPVLMANRVWAQGSEWSTPISISSVLEGPSQFPKIAADGEGQLHVVWVENSFGDRGVADAIYYSRYDGVNWSMPVDILVAPDQGTITMGELTVLPGGKLALLWIGSGGLQFSTVAASIAGNPVAWRTVPLFAGLYASSAFMLSLPDGGLTLAFVEPPGYGIRFAQSSDLGDTWSEPLTVWTPEGDGSAADDVRICANQAGTAMHLVWHENARQLGWNPYAIWHTRTSDHGATWQGLESLDNRGSSPNCVYDGSGALHMVWNNAVGSIDGRYQRTSYDDGATWSEPAPVFPGLSGRTRAPAFAIDSAGTLHILTGAYSQEKTRMFASHLRDTDWAVPLSVSGEMPSNESPDLVVTHGNVLHGVWHFGDEVSSQIWYSSVQTAAPHTVEAQQLLQRSIFATVTLLPPANPEETLAIAPLQMLTPLPSMSREPSTSVPVSPLLWSSLAGILVVGGFLVTVLTRRH